MTTIVDSFSKLDLIDNPFCNKEVDQRSENRVVYETGAELLVCEVVVGLNPFVHHVHPLPGLGAIYKLAEIVGGTTIYIPKPESLTRPVRDARIKKEFTGYNHQELARKYGVTERWVRRICGPGQAEGQIGIFDYLEDPGDEYEDEGPCNS